MANINAIKSQKSIHELLNFGIINIDKPSGPTSFNVSDFVRKIMGEIGVNKTSHFGTLDPKVSGVLPIALNRACKLTGFFLGEDKEYVGIMRIHEDISTEKIKEAIREKFLGKISQLPPLKSRVKRVEREREIKSFEILEKDGKDILFKAEVQGGTYIRKLISDLGDYLKAEPPAGSASSATQQETGIGAHMLELRRIRAGIFNEEESVNLYELEKAIDEFKKGDETSLRKIIIPGEIVSEIYPVIEIKENNLKNILTGKPIHTNDLKNVRDAKKINKESLICIFNEDKFIEVARVINENNIFAKPEFVFS